MKKLKVIFLPWLLVISLFAGSCLPVMAAEETESISIVYPKDFESMGYDCIIDFGNGQLYCLYTSDKPLTFSADSSDNHCLVALDNVNCKRWISRGSLDFSGSTGTSYSSEMSGYPQVGYYSNYDIYWTGSDEIFFQLPLPPLSRIVAGMKAELMGTVVLREILTMIPLLIPLLAGYLGLRKALREVSRILRTA